MEAQLVIMIDYFQSLIDCYYPRESSGYYISVARPKANCQAAIIL